MHGKLTFFLISFVRLLQNDVQDYVMRDVSHKFKLVSDVHATGQKVTTVMRITNPAL